MGKIFWVTLGGGEPFLRKDFYEIAYNICYYLEPKIVNIPSNGSEPNNIYSVLDQLTKDYPKTQFVVNLSIDHIGDKHDQIRGVPGSFESVYKAVQLLKSIDRPKLSIGVNTVISKHNLEEFPFIYDWIIKNIQPDTYIIEDAQIRDEYRNKNEEFFSQQLDYLKAIDFFLKELKYNKKKGYDRIKKAFRITYYNFVKNSLKSNNLRYKCYAGILSCQISFDGEVWVCATKKSLLGDLKEYGFDFRKLWFSKQADKARQDAQIKKCLCYLSNTFHSNILLNPKQLIQTLFNYLRY
jgi:MoaA/NifB/PqqE/SkfB family radical SAM enzyme